MLRSDHDQTEVNTNNRDPAEVSRNEPDDAKVNPNERNKAKVLVNKPAPSRVSVECTHAPADHTVQPYGSSIESHSRHVSLPADDRTCRESSIDRMHQQRSIPLKSIKKPHVQIGAADMRAGSAEDGPNKNMQMRRSVNEHIKMMCVDDKENQCHTQ